MSVSKMSPEVIVSAFFYPRCVVRHSSSVLAQSRLWRNGFLWKIRGAERRSGENGKHTRYEHGAWFAGTNRYWLVLQSARKEGEGGHVSFIYRVTRTSFLYVWMYVHCSSVFRAMAREQEVSNKLAGLQTRQSSLFPRKVPRVSYT